MYQYEPLEKHLPLDAFAHKKKTPSPWPSTPLRTFPSISIQIMNNSSSGKCALVDLCEKTRKIPKTQNPKTPKPEKRNPVT